jgi:hypothetical protein
MKYLLRRPSDKVGKAFRTVARPTAGVVPPFLFWS